MPPVLSVSGEFPKMGHILRITGVEMIMWTLIKVFIVTISIIHYLTILRSMNIGSHYMQKMPAIKTVIGFFNGILMMKQKNMMI